MRRLVAVVPALVLAGCLSQSSLDGFALSSEYLREQPVYFVKRHATDRRDLDIVIAQELRRAGLDAVTGEPERFDYLVTYEDLWYWDMRMYLIDLRIDVRDAQSNVLVATGRSYQTSLAAMGKTPASISRDIVRILTNGPMEPETSATKRPRRRGR